ncbi:MAG: dTDP-4-keto-6-deoxy-D-glucose epimerase [Kiritimatiellaeota bacterium]|nr:dTDP-4-keto-6-deoxy-D-glucose epimerase [Kiritimatiellota bacterium]
MKFTPTALAGAWLIEPEPLRDERGFFARCYCEGEFLRRGLNCRWVQWSISHNVRAATLRGLHRQVAPHEETKLVRCTTGSAWDVLLDLRPESDTHLQTTGVLISAANRVMVYIPPGIAHGFLTLEDNTELLYHISEFYHPESARGYRWDDPAFNITWPIQPRVISPKDAGYPDYRADGPRQQS